MLLLDLSGAINQTMIDTNARELLRNSYCILKNSPGSQIGLALFSGANIIEAIPLRERTQNEWNDLVSALYTAFSGGGAGKLMTVSPYGPTVEGLQLAHKMMKEDGVGSHLQQILVITAGVPKPLFGVSKNSPKNSLALPYNTYLFDSKPTADYCFDVPSPNKVSDCYQTTVRDYYFVKLYNESQLIIKDDIILTVLAVPGSDGKLPDLEIWRGRSNYPDYPSGCTHLNPSPSEYCARPYESLACACGTLNGPLVSNLTSENVIPGDEYWRVGKMLDKMANAMCQTVSPTMRPTMNPTTKPTRNPTRNPNRNPTTRKPTKTPTLNPVTTTPTLYQPFCPSCGLPVVRDLVILVDLSGSMNQTFVNFDLREILKELQCTVLVAGSMSGIAVFNGERIVEAVPLRSRSLSEWVDAIAAAYLEPDLFVIGGTTPTVEALELAKKMLVQDGDSTHDQQIIIVTDGAPNAMVNVKLNHPKNGATGLPRLPTTLYDASPTNPCNINLEPVPNCRAVTPTQYMFDVLYDQAQDILRSGIRISMVAIKSADGTSPDVRIWSGVANPDDLSCVSPGPEYFCTRLDTTYTCSCGIPKGALDSRRVARNILVSQASWTTLDYVARSSGMICESSAPTRNPTQMPTTSIPTVSPTKTTMKPTRTPSVNPATVVPTRLPTLNPTRPTKEPTLNPTRKPTKLPTRHPLLSPGATHSPETFRPTLNPSSRPSFNPTGNPTRKPTLKPIKAPTLNPTERPSRNPTEKPTRRPTMDPSLNPTRMPTMNPTKKPTRKPSRNPTRNPSRNPTLLPSQSPLRVGETRQPTTQQPSDRPTLNPTFRPTRNPRTQVPTTDSPSDSPR